MAVAWYVLQVYSNNERKVEKLLRQKISAGKLSKDVLIDIKLPIEEITEVKDGKKRILKKVFLPGYVLLEMDLPDKEKNWKELCSELIQTPGVNGFVATRHNNRPNPLSSEEARNILQRTGEIKGERPVRARQTYAVGEQVKIIEGPFESFTGTIDDVNTEKNRLKVMVVIFGRNTAVEVDIIQVEKV
ncbi:MAG: transcription termination/antitermination protein NusG [Spirochaetaceae bacterium]|jgi:transcriptional antiterminator NusG|nr:transcription termination/antitermination protein NusG [Spirochaetaceae bacterium]